MDLTVAGEDVVGSVQRYWRVLGLTLFVACALAAAYVFFGGIDLVQNPEFAAISPLIALAWAFPHTQKYAQAFIGGWGTALAMGSLAMLVLHFTFALIHGGATPIQGVTNWLYALASWVLLLIVPYQLHGASQTVTAQAFRLTQGAERRVRKTYRKHTTTDRSGHESHPRFDHDDTVNSGTGPDWFDEDYFED